MTAGQQNTAPIDLGGRSGQRLVVLKPRTFDQHSSAGRTMPVFPFASHRGKTLAANLFHEETIADYCPPGQCKQALINKGILRVVWSYAALELGCQIDYRTVTDHSGLHKWRLVAHRIVLIGPGANFQRLGQGKLGRMTLFFAHFRTFVVEICWLRRAIGIPAALAHSAPGISC